MAANETGQLWTGLWLSAVLLLTTWVGLYLAASPARAALHAAEGQLIRLEASLSAAQEALAPFDLLSRPETGTAVHTLGDLARAAQDTPLLDMLFSPQALNDAVTLTQQWETSLTQRPPLPALADARDSVQAWAQRVQHLQRRLTWSVVLVATFFSLLIAWFAAGQLALYRAAQERLGLLHDSPDQTDGL